MDLHEIPILLLLKVDLSLVLSPSLPLNLFFFFLHQFYIMLIVPLKRIPSLLTHNILASPYNLLVSEFVEYLSASELSCVLFYSLNASPPMSPTQ